MNCIQATCASFFGTMASLATLHDGLAMVAQSWSDMSAAEADDDENLDAAILVVYLQGCARNPLVAHVFMFLFHKV